MVSKLYVRDALGQEAALPGEPDGQSAAPATTSKI
jgi:hypothetical protein